MEWQSETALEKRIRFCKKYRQTFFHEQGTYPLDIYLMLETVQTLGCFIDVEKNISAWRYVAGFLGLPAEVVANDQLLLTLGSFYRDELRDQGVEALYCNKYYLFFYPSDFISVCKKL